MNRTRIQLETKCFQETNIIRHNLFIAKIKFMLYNGIDVIITKQIINTRLIPYIFKQDIQRL